MVAALLAELRTHAPTVLVLEDVHWADEATLDALALLAGRVAAAPALALVSYRDDELGNAAQLQFVLGELVRRPRRLRLERLSFPAVAILAAQRGLNPDELYRSTGGNPFFVTEIVAAGSADPRDGPRRGAGSGGASIVIGQAAGRGLRRSRPDRAVAPGGARRRAGRPSR